MIFKCGYASYWFNEVLEFCFLPPKRSNIACDHKYYEHSCVIKFAVSLVKGSCFYYCQKVTSCCINLQGLFGPMGLRSANPLEQEAAISSLSTLMSISPGETYLEFEKVKQLYVNIFVQIFVFSKQ